MKIEDFKKGIFNMPHRRFGMMSQLMIQSLFDLKDPKNNFHDLYDIRTDEKIEVKFSVVRSAWKCSINKSNILDCISETLNGNKVIPFKQWDNFKFDCNMNQVKPNEFDWLYYGLFFLEDILIFKTHTSNIGSNIFYSNKQHKGNIGEGQFHINNKTLPLHMKINLVETMNYETLYEILKKLS